MSEHTKIDMICDRCGLTVEKLPTLTQNWRKVQFYAEPVINEYGVDQYGCTLTYDVCYECNVGLSRFMQQSRGTK